MMKKKLAPFKLDNEDEVYTFTSPVSCSSKAPSIAVTDTNLVQPNASNRSSSPLVIKSANNDSDWRLEEGDKPSRALQVVKELHARYSAALLTF